MRTLKYELAVAGAAVLGLAGFVAVQSAASDQVQVASVDQFTLNDFNAFDRNFALDDTECAVGLRDQKLCFGESPYETHIKVGDTLSPEVPVLAAEFRVILETDLKVETLRTVRFGDTLVLIDPKTRIVHDMLRLDAPRFEEARMTPFMTSERL